MAQKYFVIAPDSLGQEIPAADRLPKEFPGVLERDARKWASKEHSGWLLVVVIPPEPTRPWNEFHAEK